MCIALYRLATKKKCYWRQTGIEREITFLGKVDGKMVIQMNGLFNGKCIPVVVVEW